MVVRKAVEEFCPDLIVCHHLYLLTALVREWYPKKKVIGICHGSDLRQICKNPLQMEYIQKWIPQLDGIVALHDGQKKEIIRIFKKLSGYQRGICAQLKARSEERRVGKECRL